MLYLERFSKAISEYVPSNEAAIEAVGDISYGISLGSESALKQHIDCWTSDWWGAVDISYQLSIKEINELAMSY